VEELRVFMKLENKFPNHYDWRKTGRNPSEGLKKVD
jgi:hypothetical protein